MFTTYQNLTLTPTDFEDSPELDNSYSNTFINCVFVGTFTGINFTRSTFYTTCDFSGATFEGCNFTDINPGLTSGVSPEAVSILCNFATEIPSADYETGVPGLETVRVALPVQQEQEEVQPDTPPEPTLP